MNAARFSIILAVILAAVAPAADYFPLQTGNRWSYTMSNGMQMSVVVTGVAPVGGVQCSIVETTVGWQKSREYMAYHPDGLKTYKTEAQGQEFVYPRPVTRIQLPLEAGQTWTSTLNQGGMSITTTNQTVGAERIETPVGAFDCIKIRSTASLPGQPPMISMSYYAAGIGLVHQTVQAGGQELVATLAATNVRANQQRQAQPQPQPQPEPQPEPEPTPPPVQELPRWETPPTPPVEPAQPPAVTAKPTRCAECNAPVKATDKFCSQCGAKIVRPVAPTHCPKCNTKLPAGAKFCPACGEKLAMPAAAAAEPTETSVRPEPTQTMPKPEPVETPDLEKYESPDGTVRLFKPQDWVVQQETFGPGSMAVSVLEPEENAAVVFMTFPVDQGIGNSIQLMARCMTGLREEYPDIEATSVSSSPEKDRTIATVTLTAEGKKGIGHGYFFYTQRAATVYFLLAREDMWEPLRPMLTSVAANLAYAPQGVETVMQQGRALADQTPIADGPAVSPAVMLQRAAQRPGRQLPLRPVALQDQSLMLQIPEGWALQGQKLQFTTFNDPQTKMYGVGSGSHTIIPTQMSIPGTINAPYQPPLQALSLVLHVGQVGTDFELLGECPTEDAVPEAVQVIQQMRAQGLHVDARLLHVRFKSMATGATLRGLFAVQCSSVPMSPVWQIVADGSWAPDNEYEEWLPLYLQIAKSGQVNQQWFQGEMQGRYVRQQQLNRGLQNSIAESNRAFDDYMGSLRDADRSRDYTSHMWSQTTLGQGTWVAENEGARVYETDSWGIEGPEGRLDSNAFNTTNFTGENPWDGTQLDLVDTREEYEQYVANPTW